MSKQVKESKGRVVIGMTGRLESTVAAFLLKKQGYDCIGVGISFFAGKEINEETHFQIEDFSHIMEICNFLEIPFYAVDAKSNFEADVTTKIIAARLAGQAYSTAPLVNELVLNILHQKAELLKADFIATGHFAKVHRNYVTGESFLMSSSALDFDQSFLLSMASEELLENLILPLAEIGEKEVLKIANVIREEIELINGKELSYELDEEFIRFAIEKMVAPSLCPDGDIVRLKDEVTVCSHEGIHLYKLGQHSVVCGNDNALEKKLHILKITPGLGTIFVGRLEENTFSGCFVRAKNLSPKLNRALPMNVLVKSDGVEDLSEATLYFKTHDCFVLEFAEEFNSIYKGEYIVVYQQMASAYRVIAAGTILEVNNYNFYDRIYASANGEDDDQQKFLALKSRYGYYF